jgi:hypothetical protein
MHAKAFKQSIIHSKKNNNTWHNKKKQLPSLVQGSPVESPSCRTLPRARRRGDTSSVAGIDCWGLSVVKKGVAT